MQYELSAGEHFLIFSLQIVILHILIPLPVWRRCVLLLICLFVNTALFCQWRIDHISVAEGLSQGYVYAIHQDTKGFIWIGTHGGLNRYDGYKFRVFQYSPFEKSTLADNAVFFLKEDRLTGKFWIGGSSALNEFDPDTFINVRHQFKKKQKEYSDGMFVSDHEILLACEDAVILFNTSDKTFVEIPVYDEDNNPTTIIRVENLSSDNNGNFMVMSSTGIFFFDKFKKSCHRKLSNTPNFSSFNNYEVFNVLNDSRGYYWIASKGKGLIRFDAITNKFTTLALPANLKNEELRFDVVIEDSKKNIWAGSSRGLFRINSVTLETEYFSSHAESDAQESLNHSEVNAIYEDKDHFIWVGTVGGGINKLISKNTGFKNYPLATNEDGEVSGTYIMAIGELGGYIWFANIWDQIGRVEKRSGSVEMLTRPRLPQQYRWYSEGTIISNNKELLILNGEDEYLISSDKQKSLLIDTKHAPGTSFVTTLDNGKQMTFVKNNSLKTFCRNDTIFGNQFFYDAKQDSKGNTWIGTSNGLFKYEPQQNRFTQYQHDDGNVNSVSSDYIYGLQLDDQHQMLWMAAYNGGLCSYNIATNTFRHYDQRDGISDNTVYSIEKDSSGNFWFSTNAGLSAYDSKTKTFRNYSVSDGLLNHEFNRRASFKNAEGWLFFGGVSGMDYFHPDSIAKDHSRPALAFTRFQVLNDDYLPYKRGNDMALDLKPEARHITVEFASLNYYDPQKVQYAYRLNTDEWIALGSTHSLSFSDLPSGTQKLSVRSTDSEGMWLHNDISCFLVISPWWWETWWFKTAITFLIVASLVALTRLYFLRKLEKQRVILEKRRAVERERTRIATDMHDDLGANLSRIKFLSETIGIKKQRHEAVDEEISNIRIYSNQMIEKMGEIVWALNEKNDSLNDLLVYTRAYAVEYLSEHGITPHVQVDAPPDESVVSGEFRRNIFLTVKEALHNVVKHSEATLVKIKIEANDQLFISIYDNGRGFDEHTIRSFSNGIANMKKRIVGLDGTIQITNSRGSTITVIVPIPLT